MGQIWRRLTDCLESVPMSCLSLSFNYRKWVVEAEKRLDSIRGIVTSKRMNFRMHEWFAVFSTIHSHILLTECASESLYSVQNIANHRIRLIFESSNTLVYRLGPSHNVEMCPRPGGYYLFVQECCSTVMGCLTICYWRGGISRNSLTY